MGFELQIKENEIFEGQKCSIESTKYPFKKKV
jgi:hypothetical protein